MNIKPLPLMIGIALAGGVTIAQADVTLFGRIDESYNYAKGGKISGTNDNYWKFISQGNSNSQLYCNDCEVGVKGSEDLGNGLKALFKLAWQYDINGNQKNLDNGGFTGRDQWIGLGGGFGKLQAGTMSTVYKSYGSDVDPVYTTVAQGKNIGLQSHLHSGRGDLGQGRATNTIGYSSPSWKGLELDATYTIQPDSNSQKGKPFSAGLKYENGGLFASVAYLSNGAGGDDSATQVSAQYTFDKLTISGQYEFDGGLITDDRTGTLGQNNTGDGADVWFVGAAYAMGNNTLYAAYGQGDNAKTYNSSIDEDTGLPVGNVSEPKYKSWEIVGIHHFSKLTMAYLGYVGNDPDDDNVDTVNQYALGLQHRF